MKTRRRRTRNTVRMTSSEHATSQDDKKGLPRCNDKKGASKVRKAARRKDTSVQMPTQRCRIRKDRQSKITPQDACKDARDQRPIVTRPKDAGRKDNNARIGTARTRATRRIAKDPGRPERGRWSGGKRPRRREAHDIKDLINQAQGALGRRRQARHHRGAGQAPHHSRGRPHDHPPRRDRTLPPHLRAIRAGRSATASTSRSRCPPGGIQIFTDPTTRAGRCAAIAAIATGAISCCSTTATTTVARAAARSWMPSSTCRRRGCASRASATSSSTRVRATTTSTTLWTRARRRSRPRLLARRSAQKPDAARPHAPHRSRHGQLRVRLVGRSTTDQYPALSNAWRGR